MNPSKFKDVGLMGLGVLTGALAVSVLRPPQRVAQVTPPVRAQPSATESAPARPARIEPDRESSIERKISQLEARIAEQSAVTNILQARLGELSARIGALSGGASGELNGGEPGAGDVATVAPAAPAPPARETIDYSKSAMQRALEAAGLDEDVAEAIKLRGDQLAMTEMYLRDQATREDWLDTPRFHQEMAELEAQRTSIRDELGDDAFDRYLFALGRTNRVIVNDVMFDSVAENVGLETGDLIISYGEHRIFEPNELVAKTSEGTVGDGVTVEVMRNGKRFEIEVPRGPLGLRIGSTQDHPDAGGPATGK